MTATISDNFPEHDLGGGFRLFAFGEKHVLITTRTAAALDQSPAGLARALITANAERRLRACRLGTVDLALGRLEVPAAGGRVEVTLACLPGEQLAAARALRKVKRAIASWARGLQ